MRSRTFILLVAGAVCVGLLWFIFRIHATTIDLRSQIDVAQERKARLRADLQRAEKTTVTRITPLPATPAPASTQAPAPARAPRPPGLMDLAHDNPQLMNLWVANQRSQIQQRYGVLFQKLNLTAAQRDKFKDTLAANTARGADIGAAAKEQGLNFDDPVIKKLHADSKQQMEAELAALLGDQNFRAYQDFERTVRVRGFIDGFAVQMATSDPLTPTQAEQLAQSLIASSPPAEKNGDINPAKIDWAAADRTASTFLSPAQLAAWKLGVAHNPYGGSRNDHELTKVYEAAKAKAADKPPGS